MLNAVSFQHAVSTTQRDFLKRRASCKLQVRHGYAAQLRKGSASGNHNHSRSLPLSFNIRRGLIWKPDYFCWIFWIYVAVLGGKVLPKTIFFWIFCCCAWVSEWAQKSGAYLWVKNQLIQNMHLEAWADCRNKYF